ncbi:hypothetical protein [uncultured Thioclava sp.]|jgi:hypothetical protein|nr:hypothetical protein [uncultured Thioclava sp.]
MSKRMIQLIENQRLVQAAHWTAFSLGVLALAASITATAVHALFS